MIVDNLSELPRFDPSSQQIELLRLQVSSYFLSARQKLDTAQYLVTLAEKVLVGQVSDDQLSLEIDSVSFWRRPLNIEGQPFKSKLKRDVLIQLRKKFRRDPREYLLMINSSEGHDHISRNPQDWIENFSADIINRNSLKREDFWVDWTCEGGEDCASFDPEECNFKGYVSEFRGRVYSPEGMLIRS